MNTRFGCASLSDDEFLSRFEDCQLEPGTFHHADHIRLAWLHIARYGAVEAEQRLLTGIRKMAMHAGVPEKFMHTTTVAWVRLIASATASGPKPCEKSTFTDWIARHPEFLDKNLLSSYYSVARLQSPAGRAGWIDPDLQPLTRVSDQT